MVEMAEALHICVDSNEASARLDIVNYFRLSGVDVEIRKLDVCDYVVSDRCGVERKGVSDFLGSIKDGRLFRQAKDLAEAYEKPILIIEGHMPRALKRSRMRPTSVYGAIASLALDFGFSIVPTESPESTAVLLHRLAYREQAEENRPIQLRNVNRSLPLSQQQMFLLAGLPQIGTTLAHDLLAHFDTPYRVLEEFANARINLSPSGRTKKLQGPLTEVRGIGPVIVENAQKVLKGSFSFHCEATARE
jgi:Fanconi anemia group M protein